MLESIKVPHIEWQEETTHDVDDETLESNSQEECPRWIGYSSWKMEVFINVTTSRDGYVENDDQPNVNVLHILISLSTLHSLERSAEVDDVDHQYMHR